MSNSPFTSGSDDPIYVDPMDPPESSESLQRVLLVTDRVRERHVLMSALEALPVATAFASSRHDCLRLAETLCPNLVVVDVELRGHEGWSICDDLIARSSSAHDGEDGEAAWHPEILAVHGGAEGVAERAEALGLQHQLRWPFAVDEARSALEPRIAGGPSEGDGVDLPADHPAVGGGRSDEIELPDDLDLVDWAVDLEDAPDPGSPNLVEEPMAPEAGPGSDDGHGGGSSGTSVFPELADVPLGDLAPVPVDSVLAGVESPPRQPPAEDHDAPGTVDGRGVVVEEDTNAAAEAGAPVPEIAREALPSILSDLFSADGVSQVMLLECRGRVVFTSSRTPQFSLTRLASHSLDLMEQAEALLRESTEAGGEDEPESAEAVVVEGRRGCVLLRNVDRNHRLVVCVERKSGLGQVRFLIRRIEQRLAQALAVDGAG